MWGWVRLHWDLMIDSWVKAIKEKLGIAERDRYIAYLEAHIDRGEDAVRSLMAATEHLSIENNRLQRRVEISEAMVKERFFVKNTPVTWLKDDYGNN